MQGNRRLTAIMFTDMVGYTALMGKDEGKAYELLSKNRRLHQSLIKKFKGRFLKEMGDGILASFHAASNAVSCAMAIQQAAIQENISLRIGIHEGEVIFENKDILGDGVNIASRIEQSTEPGCITISETVFNDIKNKPEIECEFLGERTFKNVENPVKLYKVLFDPEKMSAWDRDVDRFSNIPYRRTIYPTLAILVLIVAVLFFMIPKWTTNPYQDRSIAVLPFDNESSDANNAYFVNGMTEDIRNNLAKIGALRVVSKTSTEQYRDRNNTVTAKDIAAELEVNYLLEGTVQKQDNRIKIHAQLIRTDSDDHIWAETYIRDLDDVFAVQNEIATSIAAALHAVITPDELSIIKTIPTQNITAYDIFLRARDHHNIYWLDARNEDALEEAIVLYRRALEYDSTFARAYTGLALAYSNKHYWDQYFKASFMDSVLVLVDKALSFDDQLDEAYYVRGMYYASQKDGINKALKDYETALNINPNYVEVYNEKSIIDAWTFDDYVEAIKNRRMTIRLDHSRFLPRSLRSLGILYTNTGFYELGRDSYLKAFQLDNDSVAHYNTMSWNYYFGEGNIQEAYNAGLKAFKIDTTHIFSVMLVMQFSSFLGNYEEANQFAIRLLRIFESYNIRLTGDWHRIGYTYLKTGNPGEAERYFDEQVKWCEESIKLERQYATSYGAYYDLACVLALRGETDRAFDLLSELKNKNFFPSWMISQFQYEPFFDSIREDERFVDILQDIKQKYQTEHERVKLWMDKEGNN